jgi:hypothetical protein
LIFDQNLGAFSAVVDLLQRRLAGRDVDGARIDRPTILRYSGVSFISAELNWSLIMQTSFINQLDTFGFTFMGFSCAFKYPARVPGSGYPSYSGGL